MASNDIIVDDIVSTDVKGQGIVTEVVWRGFATFCMVKFVNTDFEVELLRDRLAKKTENTTCHHNAKQTTQSNPSSSRFKIVLRF